MDCLLLGEKKNTDGDSVHPAEKVENELHDSLCLNELKFDDFLNGLLKIEVIVVVSALQEENGVIKVIEFRNLRILSQTSDLLSDDKILEINIEVFDLYALFLVEFLLVSEVDLVHKFPLDIMEVVEFHLGEVFSFNV